MALLFTLITGVFFLFGVILNLFVKNKKRISVLSIALAFVVMINLLLFDIMPEVFEEFNIVSILFIILGFFTLNIMDLFVPHHHHDHKETNDNEKEHNHHLEHISIITIIALSLHNIIECMALYNVTIKDWHSGLLMAIAIGLHNMPLGFQIGNNLERHKIISVLTLVLSGFVGGIISLVIGSLPEVFTLYILSFTLGMLIYLTICELFKELLNEIKNKYTFYGIIIGIILIVLTNLL